MLKLNFVGDITDNILHSIATELPLLTELQLKCKDDANISVNSYGFNNIDWNW